MGECYNQNFIANKIPIAKWKLYVVVVLLFLVFEGVTIRMRESLQSSEQILLNIIYVCAFVQRRTTDEEIWKMQQ